MFIIAGTIATVDMLSDLLLCMNGLTTGKPTADNTWDLVAQKKNYRGRRRWWKWQWRRRRCLPQEKTRDTVTLLIVENEMKDVKKRREDEREEACRPYEAEVDG